MRNCIRLLLPMIVASFLPIARPAAAQSTIFNVPTTDTVDKGKVHSGFDWLAQNPNSRGLDRLHLLRPKVAVGVLRNLEVGVNVPMNHRAFTNDDTYLEPNAKWRFAASEKKGLAASAGTIVVTPLSEVFPSDTYAIVYG